GDGRTGVERDRAVREAAVDLGQAVAGDRALTDLVGARQQRVARAGCGAGGRATRHIDAGERDVEAEVGGRLRAAAVRVVHDLLHDQRREPRVRERARHVLAELEALQRDRGARTGRRPIAIAAAAPRARIQRTVGRCVAGLADREVAGLHVDSTGRAAVAVALACVVEHRLALALTERELERARVGRRQYALLDRDRRRVVVVVDRAGDVLAEGDGDVRLRDRNRGLGTAEDAAPVARRVVGRAA